MKRFNKLKILFAVFFISSGVSFGQDNYRSISNGNWNGATTWEKDVAGNGVYSATSIAPTGTSGIINIYHSITVTATLLNIDQTIVNSGGSLTINAGTSFSLGNGTGDELTVNFGGTLNNNGTLSFVGITSRTAIINGTYNNSGVNTNASNTRLIFGANSNYNHNFNSGTSNTIPTAGWNSNSTCQIIATNNLTPSGLNQTFGNFTWNYAAQETEIDLGGFPTSVSGDFSVENTGIGALILGTSGANNLNVADSLKIKGGTFALSYLTATASTINLGAFHMTGGDLILTQDANMSIKVNGPFSFTGGNVIDFSQGIGNSTFIIKGNYTHTGTGLYSNSGGTVSTIQFGDGFESTIVYTSNVDHSAPINFNVYNLAIVDVEANSYFHGSGTFQLGNGGTLIIRNIDGAGAFQENGGVIRIPTSNRIYSDNGTATIIFKGTTNQSLGNAYTDKAVNLTIDNGNFVTIPGSVAIIQAASTLNLKSGVLDVGNTKLIIAGNLTVETGSLHTTSGSSLTITGVDDLAFPIPFDATTTQLGTFTIDRTGTGNVSLGKNMQVTTLLDLKAGNLIINDRTFTIIGNLNNNGGNFSGNNATRLIINGTGTLTGTLPFSATGNTIKLLQIERTNSGQVTLGSELIISDTLALFEGTFITGSNDGSTKLLTMGDNSLIRRRNGTLNTSPKTVSKYNVFYGNGTDALTGPELPTADNLLQNLTIARNSGTITLNSNVTVNGNFLINTGTINTNAINNYTINLKGNFTNNATFVGNSGNIIFSGSAPQTIGGITPTTFYGLEINNAAGVSLSGSNITYNINTGGNLNLVNGALSIGSNTLNISGSLIVGTGSLTGGTTSSITFSGSGNASLPTVAGGLSDLTINRTGSTITMVGPTTVAGTLFLTEGSLASGSGNLTIDLNSGLISGSGNGAISGSLNVTKSITETDYHQIATPLASATAAQINDDVALNTQIPKMYYYNEPNTDANFEKGWVGVTSTSTAIDPLKGYTLYFTTPTSLDITGTYTHIPGVNPSVTVTHTPSSTPINDAWNLIGNPYPSPFDWLSATTSNVANEIHYWDATIGDYASFVNNISTNNGSRYIPSMQAFWVYVNTPGSGTVTFNNAGRTGITTNRAIYRTAAEDRELRLKGKGELKEEETVIYLEDSSTYNFDSKYDAHKLVTDYSFYSFLNNTAYSINAIPEISDTLVIPLRLTGINGAYTITATEFPTVDSRIKGIYLVDKAMNKSQNLLIEPEYTTTVSTSDNADRFELNFEVDNLTSLEENNYPRFYVSSEDKNINVKTHNCNLENNQIIVTNLQGIEVLRLDKMNMPEQGLTIPTNLNDGVYLVKLTTENKTFVKKVYISE